MQQKEEGNQKFIKLHKSLTIQVDNNTNKGFDFETCIGVNSGIFTKFYALQIYTKKKLGMSGRSTLDMLFSGWLYLVLLPPYHSQH